MWLREAASPVAGLRSRWDRAFRATWAPSPSLLCFLSVLTLWYSLSHPWALCKIKMEDPVQKAGRSILSPSCHGVSDWLFLSLSLGGKGRPSQCLGVMGLSRRDVRTPETPDSPTWAGWCWCHRVRLG